MAAIANSSIALAIVALLIFSVGLFVPIEAKPFVAGEEFLISPLVSLLALAAALFAWLQTAQRKWLHHFALTLATAVFAVSAGFTALFLLAYSNCPNGVC